MANLTQIALIQAEIDGELTDQQRAELSSHLLADPAVRAMREQMRRLCQALDHIPQVEPPKSLRSDVLAALPQMQVRRSVRPALQWRYAAVLAGVLLTGTVVFRIMDFGQGPSANDMAGTLTARRAAVSVDVVQLSPGIVSGQVSLLRDGADLSVALQLAAHDPLDVLVESEGRSTRLNGLVSQPQQGTKPATVTLPRVGSSGQPVYVTISMGEQEVARAVLREPSGH
jgi:anti-sigma factor RsiW